MGWPMVAIGPSARVRWGGIAGVTSFDARTDSGYVLHSRGEIAAGRDSIGLLWKASEIEGRDNVFFVRMSVDQDLI